MGFVSTLTLLFIVLKLIGVLSWSWLWILSPIWLTGSIFISVAAFIMIGGRMKKTACHIHIDDESFQVNSRKK